MEKVKLIGSWISPYSHRVEVGLRLKGVEYEFIDEDLSNKSPLLLKHNPIHKKVPVLLRNDKPIVESLVILEYIDEVFSGTPILPSDPYERALARFWANFFDEKFFPTTKKAIFTKGEEQERAKEETHELMKILDNELKEKKFFGGESIGFVDIAANYVALWFGILEEVMGVELSMTKEKYPNLCRWKEDFLNCDVVKDNLAPRHKLIAYFRKRFIPNDSE